MCPAGFVPALRHGDRLPGVLDEPTGAVAGIVARAEAPRPLAREQECLGAEAVANPAQAGALAFGVCQAAVVRCAEGRPPQPVDAQVVVAPFSHDAAGQIEQPLLPLGVGAVERVDLATPGFARLTSNGSGPIPQ